MGFELGLADPSTKTETRYLKPETLLRQRGKEEKKAIKELDENKLNCFNLGSRNKSRVGFIVLAIFGLIRTKARVDIILLVSGLNIFISS